MSQKVGKNRVFGDWKLKKFLGGGGNGDVWLVVNSRNEEAAIKLLRKIERKTYSRFINEVNIIKANSDIEGILPILDSYLPDIDIGEIPWYVMPVAQPLENYLDEKHFEDVVAAVKDVAKTLFELHKRDISHRDIKPENLLVRNERVYLADFGLVDYPDKINITSSGDVIGAKWTMAPEMRREGNKANGRSADVYSLAKTFWILITKNKKGFDGQYDPTGINSLNRLSLKEKDKKGSFYDNDNSKPTLFIKPIDDLLRNCTYDLPMHRPTMQNFYETVSWWKSSHKDLEIRNPIEWRDLQKRLFPTTMPQRVIWENLYDIAMVLSMIGSTSYLNHMYYPSGGGMDLRGAKVGLESDTIELIIDENYIDLIKPKRLIFEGFKSDTQWNYFRIETGELEPTGIKSVFRQREELMEVEPLNYVSRWDWESEAYEGERPSGARHINRYLRGDFVIFAKRSIYNHASSTYDARHNQLNADEFREYISQKVEMAEALLQEKGLVKFAEEKGITMNEVLNGYFEKNFYEDHLARFRRKEQEMDRE